MADRWIAGAIQHPGTLIKRAKREGVYHDGKIDRAWLEKLSKAPEPWGARARLALRMRAMD